MEAALNHLLHCTMEWSPQWFNKAKFHFLLHLLDHIQRFGPAILFATETFESYNVVIQAWCINSNCLAPSRDTANRSARLAHVRHLISGGFYPAACNVAEEGSQSSQTWTTAGEDALDMFATPSVITHRLGLHMEKQEKLGVLFILLFMGFNSS